jgi:hypothetical protein
MRRGAEPTLVSATEARMRERERVRVNEAVVCANFVPIDRSVPEWPSTSCSFVP